MRRTVPAAVSPARRALTSSVLLGLLAAVLVAVSSQPAVAQAPAEDGPDCLPAGGVDRPFETPDSFDTTGYDLIVNGGGFGHGVGMSQYGARGAANAGCGYRTILGTYYPGTTVGALSAPRDAIALHLRRIGTDPTTIRTTSAAAGGRDIEWHACEEDGATCEVVATQPAGATWVAHPRADGSFTLAEQNVSPDCDVTTSGCHWRGGTVYTRLRMMHDGAVVRVLEADTTCNGTAGLCTKWGFIEFDFTSAGNTTYVTQYVTGGDGLTAMDRYLWGLEEVPASWPVETLKTQAVAGRSYAEATIAGREAVYGRHPVAGYLQQNECRCDLYRTTRDQHWNGWERERRDTDGRWVGAVSTTVGEHVLYDDGKGGPAKAVPAFYSSSHGGFSEDVEHVWGTEYPYLKAVDTSRWECLGDNPAQRWTRGFTRAEVASRVGLDTVESFEVVARGPGGRPTTLDVDEDGKKPDGAIVTGTKDGAQVTKRYSGEALRSVLKKGPISSALMYLEWIDEPAPQPSPSPSASASPATSPSPAATAAAQDGEASCEVAPPADRVAGDGRVTTATAASAYAWEASTHVVIARADHPADALAGSGLAGELDAPLLITWKDALDQAVVDEVNRLGATTAVLLGGEAALSAGVAQGLLDRTTVETVERAEGATRIHTAVAVADRLTVPADGTALLVRGSNADHPEREWPDALSVAAIAAHQAKAGAAWPILLTGAELPQVTLDALERYGTKKVYAVGGAAVIPDAMVQQLRDLGYEVERLAGSDRWGTSRAALGLPVGDAEVLVAATGFNFPDGLAAGALAARLGGRVLLVTKTYTAGQSPWKAEEHPAAVSALGWEDGKVVIVGGGDVVADDVARALRNAM